MQGETCYGGIMGFLSPAELAKAQAASEGFQNGPQPALNPANLNTQDSIGNTQVVTTSPAPYYPSKETPNLQLTTDEMPAALANNFCILDSLLVGYTPGSVVAIIQSRLQVSDVSTPQSVSLTADADSLFQISVSMETAGDGLPTDKLVCTVSWTDQSHPPDNNVVTFDMVGDVQQIQMETYPISVKAGTTLTVSTAFTANAFHYDINARVVQMP